MEGLTVDRDSRNQLLLLTTRKIQVCQDVRDERSLEMVHRGQGRLQYLLMESRIGDGKCVGTIRGL